VSEGIDPDLLKAWLRGRSLARGLPAPVPDLGGFRVDTNSELEICRWIFASPTSGLCKLGLLINEPRYFLKLCGSANSLQQALPSAWTVTGGHWFMMFQGNLAPQESLPSGYKLEVKRSGPVANVEVRTQGGQVAASGHSAETDGAFVYDRIETDPGHRRRGLARAVMVALGSCLADRSALHLLTATAEGEKLYPVWDGASSRLIRLRASRETPALSPSAGSASAG
jgi:hypothetical protein